MATTVGDITSRIMQFEEGDMDRDETLMLFRDLLDSGWVWRLQGSYGRSAQRLLDAGVIVAHDGQYVIDWAEVDELEMAA